MSTSTRRPPQAAPQSISRLALLVALAGLGLVAQPALAQAPASAPAQADAARATVRGVIFDEDGAPMPSVEVRVGSLPVVLTNADGAFELQVEPGRYAIFVLADRYREARVNVLSVADGGSVELVMTLYRDGRAPLIDLEGAAEPPPLTLDEAQDPIQGPTRSAAKAASLPGRIQGRALSLDRRSPVQDARVFVRGLSVEARTDAQGRFTLEVPAGTYQISVIHPDYSAQSVPEVEVTAQRDTSISVELSPAAMELDDFTVTAPRIEGSTIALLDARRQAATVNEVLGAEQFTKSGDSSAAGALKRVTGLTVVGGKYVYVRGLGERYSSTLLNGATLPSPEPEQRVVPLDMFATSLLESVTIQKTYSPDQPGEFGGGVVSLQTRTDPSERQATLGVSVGYLTGTTFAQGALGPRGSLDWLGFDDGTRALPASVRTASQRATLRERGRFDTNGYTPEQLQALGRAMPNTWAMSPLTVPPNMGLSATIGDRFSLAGLRAGLRAGLTYQNGWDQDLSERSFYRVGAQQRLELRNGYQFNETNNTISAGLILTGSLAMDEAHTLRFTSMINRVSDDEGRTYRGFNRDAGADIRVSRMRWLERMLMYHQLLGQHRLDARGQAQLDWRYVFSQASRAEPDLRESRYDLEGATGDFLLSNLPEGNSRLFSDLVDDNHDLAADLTLPLSGLSQHEAKLKTGAQLVLKRRRVDTRRFKYFGLLPDAVLAQSPERIFTAQNIGPDGLSFGEITRATDNYAADQTVLAMYAMTQLTLGEALTLQGGARLEYSDQSVSTFELFNPTASPVAANLSALDIFPALNATWSLSEDAKVRAALARTVSRPDFREMSPAAFTDVAGGSSVEGNPQLERALITHADLRWEWYPRRGELWSVGAFGKRFERPIEMVLIPSAQRTVTFQNAQGATNMGVELEARKGLDLLHEALRDLYVSGNLALIRSRVQLPQGPGSVLTASQRALQGQSPYVLNLQAGYDEVESGLSVSVLYNVFGPRIMEVGALGAPDIYEQPFHQLDVVATHRVGLWRLGLRAQNLLDLPAQWTQGDQIVEGRTRGRGLSLSAGVQF